MNESTRYLTIRETARETGLSQYFLRKAVKENTLPYIMCGNRVKFNITMLMDALNQSANGKCR